MKDFILFSGLVYIVLFFVFAPIVGVSMIIEKRYCEEVSVADSSHEYRWFFWGGCKVQTPNGYWISSDNSYLIDGIGK